MYQHKCHAFNIIVSMLPQILKEHNKKLKRNLFCAQSLTIMIGYLPSNWRITCDHYLHDLRTAENIRFPFSEVCIWICRSLLCMVIRIKQNSRDKWCQIYSSFSEFEIYSWTPQFLCKRYMTMPINNYVKLKKLIYHKTKCRNGVSFLKQISLVQNKNILFELS